MNVNEMRQGGVRALLDYDNTLFDNMVVPSGIQLGEVVDNILFKYGDAPLFSPDPAVMKYYIGAWSNRRLAQWERFKEAILEEYDPLYNYNRTEKNKITLTYGHKITTNDDLKHGLTVESQISADNAATYQPDNKGINSGTDERDYDETHSGKDITEYDNHMYGNIGVTTSQQMLAAELDLIPRLNLIDYITDDFHMEFCLGIY